MAAVGILKPPTRNGAIPIGALVLQRELQEAGYEVKICDYESASRHKVVLISMTGVDDVFELYRGMARSGWRNRSFVAIIGGIGCQNPFPLRDFVDYAFFGRAEGAMVCVVRDAIAGKDLTCEYITSLSTPTVTVARSVQYLYDYEVVYGKNQTRWKENFVGCPYKCAFCHYSWNRRYLRRDGAVGYVNDGLTSSSREVMLTDISTFEGDISRITAGLDGYSERLRFMFGKKITWEMVEEAFDRIAGRYGGCYLKLYNITNFPTETEDDEQEFVEFMKEYVSVTNKPNGMMLVDVFNTAFRPSLNTPMERCAVKLFPEARKDNLVIAKGNGITVKYTHLVRGAWYHLLDVIATRVALGDYAVVEWVAMDDELRKKGSRDRLNELVKRYDVEMYLREYSWDEPFISDIVRCENSDKIRKAGVLLSEKIKKAGQLPRILTPIATA